MLRHLCITITLFLVILLPGTAYADERESALKAGFLYNFARYSEGTWFSYHSEKSYIICTTDPDFKTIASRVLKDQKIKDLPVFVEYISAPRSHCHSLFISADTPNPNEFIQDPEFTQTMLVGERKDYIQSGGHISFFIAGGKIRFEVDPKRLNAAHIKLSSKVLRMGRVVGAQLND
jgi:hypothetical protein